MKRLLAVLTVLTALAALIVGATPASATVISFTGTVTDQTTTLPIAGITVDMYKPSGLFLATTTTDVNGQFNFTDRTTSKYAFKFSDPNTVYTTEWWNDKPSLSTATIIAYTAGTTVTVNAALV